MSDVPYQSAFAALADQLPGDRAAREAAVESLAFPLRRNEAWKFTSARKLLASEHAPTSGSIVELPESVHALFDATDHPAISKLGQVASKDGFQALNLAYFREGALVFVPADDLLEGARIRIEGNDGLTTPRILVVVEEEAELELSVEHTLGAGLHVPVIEVFAGKGAKVSLTHLVRGDGGHGVFHIAVHQAVESTVNVQSIVLGGDVVRVELVTHGDGQSNVSTSGLVLARDRQHADHHLEIHHESSNMTSEQMFRHVLDDRARAIFTGQVTVGKDVTGSDASQTANTLLLADGASAVARPWLVIDNDDVVASHGATVGRLDEESMFYLRTRGIPYAEARRMLTNAFAIEIVHSVPEAFREAIESDVAAWLGA